MHYFGSVLVAKSEDGKEEKQIRIHSVPKLGQDIRPIGSDIEQGSVVLAKGQVLGPAEIGLLATVGSTKIKVFKKPVISLLSTGNELQDPDEPVLKPGHIRDSNKSTLWALIGKILRVILAQESRRIFSYFSEAEHGFSTYDAGIASDDLNDLNAKISKALDHGDLMVTTGGVSMGDKDLLR